MLELGHTAKPVLTRGSISPHSTSLTAMVTGSDGFTPKERRIKPLLFHLPLSSYKAGKLNAASVFKGNRALFIRSCGKKVA